MSGNANQAGQEAKDAQKERLHQAQEDTEISGDLKQSTQEHSKNTLDSSKDSRGGAHKDDIGGETSDNKGKVASAESSSS